MTPLILAVCLTAQYPTPQAPAYAPPQYQQPVYSIPMPAYQTQVVALGAGAVAPAGPFGQMLGHIGRKLEKHSWPRVQPVPATPMGQPIMQTVYVQVVPQMPPVQQAMYAPQPSYQAAPPQYGTKAPPAYGSPQQPAYNASPPYGRGPGPNPAAESVPPVPQR